MQRSATCVGVKGFWESGVQEFGFWSLVFRSSESLGAKSFRFQGLGFGSSGSEL